MVYITVKQPQRFHQMTLEEYMFGGYSREVVSGGVADTRTYSVQNVRQAVRDRADISRMIYLLERFNTETEYLHEGDRHSLYYSFKIEKKTRGHRQIDAPCEELMRWLRYLKDTISDEFGFSNKTSAHYHTSAFAYIKKRSTLDCVKRHQTNSSRWFAKYDFSNFFGSTTKEFVMNMLSMVFPFSEIMKDPRGLTALDTALDLAFLDGVLPQGTPISPLITNIMMIPIDHVLSNKFREFDKQRYVYTRYADDIIVSSQYDFDFRKVEAEINSVLESFHAPFQIKNEKTRYGSSAGSNWNLGVMLNKDNEITVGAKRKRAFKGMVTNYILDRKKGIAWDKEDVMVIEGFRNYYSLVEEDKIAGIIRSLNGKYGVDVVKMLKDDIRA